MVYKDYQWKFLLWNMSGPKMNLNSIWSQDTGDLDCSNYFCSPSSPIFFIVMDFSQLLFMDDDVDNKVKSMLQD